MSQTVLNTNVRLFTLGGLTFGDGASLTIELSDACLDVLLNDAYVSNAWRMSLDVPRDTKTTTVLFEATVIGDNQGTITMSDSTIARLAQRGIQLEAYAGTPEPATASLSLLALAVLSARRKRH